MIVSFFSFSTGFSYTDFCSLTWWACGICSIFDKCKCTWKFDFQVSFLSSLWFYLFEDYMVLYLAWKLNTPNYLAEKQQHLNAIYETFKEDVTRHLQDCKSTLESLEAHEVEVKATVEKRSMMRSSMNFAEVFISLFGASNCLYLE